MPATLLPIRDVMSEHCMLVAAQYWPATPYWLYRVLGSGPACAGGRTSESMPAVAGSGSGSEGWQMLFRSPVRPLVPSEQNPSSPPMSPMPGTEQTPPAATVTVACREVSSLTSGDCAASRTAVLLAGRAAAAVTAVARAEPSARAGAAAACNGAAAACGWTADPREWTAACASPGAPTAAAAMASTSTVLRGMRRRRLTIGGLLGGQGGSGLASSAVDGRRLVRCRAPGRVPAASAPGRAVPWSGSCPAIS